MRRPFLPPSLATTGNANAAVATMIIQGKVLLRELHTFSKVPTLLFISGVDSKLLSSVSFLRMIYCCFCLFPPRNLHTEVAKHMNQTGAERGEVVILTGAESVCVGMNVVPRSI